MGGICGVSSRNISIVAKQSQNNIGNINNNHSPQNQINNNPNSRNEISVHFDTRINTQHKNTISNKPPKIQEQGNPFEDFPEIPGKIIGEGVKEIPSYICKIPFDELNKLRMSFWESKKRNKQIWEIIKQCCETDSATAAALMDSANWACVDGNLRRVFSFADPDYYYEVPNFCITDPIFEKDFDVYESNELQVRDILVIIYYVLLNKESEFKITNATNVYDLKKMIAQQEGIDLEKKKIRLLFQGHEWKDDKIVYCYDIGERSKIQAMIVDFD